MTQEGAKVWERQLSVPGAVTGTRTLVSLGESVLVVGHLLDGGEGPGDAWLVVVDGAGEPLWDTLVDMEGGHDVLHDAVERDGAIAVVGDTRAPGASGFDGLTAAALTSQGATAK